VKLKRHGALVGTAALVLASTATLMGGGAASAAPPAYRVMTVSPATSSTTDVYPQFDTNAACPAPATNMIVRIYGSGLPASGENLMGNTELAVLATNGQGGKHAVAGTKLKDAFAANGILSPAGNYTVKALCVDDSGTSTFGEFAGNMAFTSVSAVNSSYTSSVDNPGTETTVDAITGSYTYGDSVTFTAHVAAESGPATGGTVQFKDGGTNLGAAQAVNGSGTATYTTTTLDAGAHSITAQYIPGAAAFGASTSSAQAFTIAKKATTVVVSTGGGSSAQYAVATFTATVTPSAAGGTVQFTKDGANLGSPQAVSGGTATFATSSLAVGTYAIGAVYTPTGGSATNYLGSTATEANHQVTPQAGGSATETITTTVAPGTINITVNGSSTVSLGTAVMNSDGNLLVAEGDITPIQITDTRAGDPGWVAQGIVQDFSNGTDSINGYNLGWTPSVVSLASNQAGFALGSPVLPAEQPTAGTVPTNSALGLGVQRVMGTAADNAGNGTAELSAHLKLQIPTDVGAGTYSAVLTFTAV
jgi:hypothetical protein